MNRHVVRPGRPSVADIRRRLLLERNLPPQVHQINEAIDYGAALLRYYGVQT